MKARRAGLLFVWLAMVCLSTAWAHKGSDAYLLVQDQSSTDAAKVAPTVSAVTEYRFSLAVALKDLDLIAPVDANADGKITWSEIKSVTPVVLPLINQAVNLKSPLAACGLQWHYAGLERRADGAYFRLESTAVCPDSQGLTLRYTLLHQQDASHRLLITGRLAGQDLLRTASPQPGIDVVLRAVQEHGSGVVVSGFSPSPVGRWATLAGYFKVGFVHLLQGYDHLAFLLALVLPLSLRFGWFNRHWTTLSASGSATTPKAQWVSLLRTVTAFTIGHSITLILAVQGLLHASPTWVEPAIAASIAFTAVLNLRPIAWLRADVLALLFGLVHGLGFAGLLLEADAPAGLLPWALAGFNFGIEGGQLLAVAAWVAAAQLFMKQNWYHRVVVRGGSVLLMVLSSWWFWERVRSVT